MTKNAKPATRVELVDTIAHLNAELAAAQADVVLLTRLKNAEANVERLTAAIVTAQKQLSAAVANEIFMQRGRENQNVAGVLHEGRETRHAERHEVEPKDLPAIERRCSATRRSCADQQGGSNYGAQPD